MRTSASDAAGDASDASGDASGQPASEPNLADAAGPGGSTPAPDSDNSDNSDSSDNSADRAPALNHLASAACAAAAGGLLFATAHSSAVALLIAVAAVQTALAIAWVVGTGQPGRIGALVIAALAAGGSDVAVSLFPRGQLGPLLVVVALAVPVIFVHQLARGAARHRILDSVGGVAILVVAQMGLACLLQVRHEFQSTGVGGQVAGGVVAAAALALVVGHLTDMVLPTQRFDAAVSRGLPALVMSAAAGAVAGQLALHTDFDFTGGRALFTGAAIGALAGFLAVAVAFVVTTGALPRTRRASRLRPLVTALLPIALVIPAGFLIVLSIRG